MILKCAHAALILLAAVLLAVPAAWSQTGIGALPALPQAGSPHNGASGPAFGGSAPASASASTAGGLTGSTEASIEQQSRGQYPVMDRGPSLPLGTLQRSWDRPSAASGQSAPGVIHYMWHPDFVMGVRTRDFMVTTLMLPAWERANEYYLGDPVVFEARKIKANVVAVRSRNAGADSNLTILGASGNVYNFYLRSESWNTSQITDLTVYIEAARQDEGQAGPAPSPATDPSAAAGDAFAMRPGMPDYLRHIVFKPEDLKFDMKMYAAKEGDAEIAPERVFEDGLFTYFDFGARADSVARPVVHQLVDGVDTLVNTRTAGPQGNVLIAEGVGDFTLRNGGRVVCVRRIGGSKPPAAVTIDEDRGRREAGDKK